MKLRKIIVPLVGIGLLFSSCTKTVDVFIVPGSTAADLAFGFSESGGEEKFTVASIHVVTCDEARRLWKDGGSDPKSPEYVWSASVPHGATSQPTSRVTYGRDEHRLRTARGPEPINTPGCYFAHIYARDRRGLTRGGTISFKAEEGGAVKKIRLKRGWLL